MEEIQVPSRQDPKPLIKSRLRDGAEHVTTGQGGHNHVYANPGGHGILRELEQMRMEMKILMANDEKKTSQIDEHQKRIDEGQKQIDEHQKRIDEGQKQIDEHQKRIDEDQKHISSLESHVKRLVQCSDGYLSIRRRFLDVFKRDIMDMKELKGSKAIREGDSRAHEGDALGDAVVFDRDQRTDRSIYRELYGLDHQQVLDFRTYTDGLFSTPCQKLTICIDSASDDGRLFLVQNAHATVVAQGRPLPDDLKVAFNFFLAKVEEYWLQPPTKEPNNPLSSAYYTFWKKFNEQAQV